MTLNKTNSSIIETIFTVLNEYNIGYVSGYNLTNKCEIYVGNDLIVKLNDGLVYQHLYRISDKLSNSQVFLLDNLCQSLQFSISTQNGG